MEINFQLTKGDMIKNHVVSTFPKENTTDVALDSPISVRFDNEVAQLDIPQIFEVCADGVVL